MMGKDGIKFTNRYKLRIRLQSAWLQEVGILEESLREGHLKTESICCFHQRTIVLTEEKSDRVEDVSQYKLHCESVNAETTTNPRQKTVDGSDQRQDGQDIGPGEGPLVNVGILDLGTTYKI
jgi:hypothetical protein